MICYSLFIFTVEFTVSAKLLNPNATVFALLVLKDNRTIYKSTLLQSLQKLNLLCLTTYALYVTGKLFS